MKEMFYDRIRRVLPHLLDKVLQVLKSAPAFTFFLNFLKKLSQMIWQLQQDLYLGRPWSSLAEGSAQQSNKRMEYYDAFSA